MAFEEDLSLFLDTDEFAVVATAINRFGEVVQFQVIFDNGHGAQFGGLADASQPSALARTVDVADLVQSCVVSIAETDWVVTDIQPDGTGMTTLLLRKP